MKNIYRLTLTGMLFILFCPLLYAQNEPTSKNDISVYMDDGGLSQMKNLVKFNSLSLVFGELPIYYERIISKVIGLEAGVGVLFPWSQNDFLSNDPFDIKELGVKGGYSIILQPRFYYGAKAPESLYFALTWHYRNYKLENAAHFMINHYLATFGMQLAVWNRLIIDLAYSMGISESKYSFQNAIIFPENLNTNFAMNFDLKLAYLF